MDGVTLLREARQSGLEIRADGDRLVVQGARRLEGIARAVLANKPSVLDALALERREIAWRVAILRPQVSLTGAIPFLIVRPGIRFPLGTCCSCGDALVAGDRYRCRPCAQASIAVLAGVR